MVSKVGIIPAAGKATRFGGLFKELLPLPNERLLLTEAVERLRFCDQIIVVTSNEKAEAHKAILPKDVIIQYQTGKELWGAIQTGFMRASADFYYMTMPDT
jgi:CTP:molybdopterin cytidylyltransferase MocA